MQSQTARLTNKIFKANKCGDEKKENKFEKEKKDKLLGTRRKEPDAA